MCWACEEQDLWFRYEIEMAVARGVIPDGFTAGFRGRRPAGAGPSDVAKAPSNPRSEPFRLRYAGQGMTGLTSLTLARGARGASDQAVLGSRAGGRPYLAAEAARALNAYVLETPEAARAMAREPMRALSRR